jgi:mannose PTS system EIIA component
MAGLLVVTHGEMANALVSTLAMIQGETEDLAAVSVTSQDSLETVQVKMEEALLRVDPHAAGALIMVDMRGGTPFNCAMQLAAGRPLGVVTGVNLPMLFKAVFRKEEKDISRLAQEVRESGRENILTSFELLKPQ